MPIEFTAIDLTADEIAAGSAQVEPKPAKKSKPTPKKPAAKKAAPIAKVQPAAKKEGFTPKAGTKRAAAYDALVRKQGCTLAQAVEILGWARGVCSAEFWEVAKLSKRKLVRDGEVYRLA